MKGEWSVVLMRRPFGTWPHIVVGLDASGPFVRGMDDTYTCGTKQGGPEAIAHGCAAEYESIEALYKAMRQVQAVTPAQTPERA